MGKSASRLLCAASLSLSVAAAGGCGGTSNQVRFERQVNELYNAQEMSRSHSDPNYIPRYNRTLISP
jgi:hypothetical protein